MPSRPIHHHTLLAFTQMLLILCAACLPLTSCMTIDHGYSSIIAQADPNPKANDITGIWHQQHNNDNIVSPLYGTDYNRSLMFRNDGTGEWYHNNKNPKALIPVNFERKGSMKWAYKGSGLWTTNGALAGWNTKLRITRDKKKLLLDMINMNGPVRAVFQREQ